MKLRQVADPERIFSKLSENLIENSGFLFRGRDLPFTFYSNADYTAVLGIEKDSDHCLFWGDWTDVEMPSDILPKDGIFVSAGPPDIVEILKQHFKLDGEWPCWHYLAPPGYGPGEWDELGAIQNDEAEYVAEYWELGGEGRLEHVKDRISRFDSSCIRIDGKPVSWTGLHFEIEGVANLGFAHTLEEHRRKGYQQIVTKAIVNRLHERGMRTTCHVIKDNTASMKLCASLGFKKVGEHTWAYFKYQ